MTHRTLQTLLLIFVINGGLVACAGTQGSPDAQRCPAGQVLTCKGGDANSRVPDSELNETHGCICQQQDRF